MATKVDGINWNLQYLSYSRNKEETKPSLLQSNVPLNSVQENSDLPLTSTFLFNHC